MTRIRLEPVRLYTVAVAAVALLAHYVTTLPSELVLGLVAAILGVGELGVRRAVTPNERVRARKR